MKNYEIFIECDLANRDNFGQGCNSMAKREVKRWTTSKTPRSVSPVITAFWIKDNPNGTLGDLLARLLEALDQCRDMASATNDAWIEDCWDNIPEPLYSQLVDWDNSEENCTFSYREANIESHVGDVEELVNELGEDFMVADLVR